MSKAYMGKNFKDSYGKSEGTLKMPTGALTGLKDPTWKADAPKQFDFLSEYISFELTDDFLDKDDLAAHFANWLTDSSDLEGYERFSMVTEDKVIVRLYRYEAVASKLILDPITGGPLTGYKILPYAKVLAAHPNGRLKLNQIVCCSEDICSLKTNPAWIEWNVGKANGDFKDVPQPDRIGGVLGMWKEFKIRKNPMEVSPDDSFTFVLSDREFKVALNTIV